MARGLEKQAIEATCLRLLQTKRRVGVRDVTAELRRLYGAAARTERVAQILRSVADSVDQALDSTHLIEELQRLHQRVREAEQRAALAEEREARHQDFWATRYGDKLAALEARERLGEQQARSAVSAGQYLRIYQKAAELARRLSQYEDVEPLIAAAPSDRG